VTLDADSVLMPEYCLRLVHLLEQSEYRDMSIAQTPYSAFPGSATRLERIAGATTDLQHIVHQGLTYYDATFWVGANAVIRKRALDEIAETSYIGDWEIRHYIRDRTVIEDTESTIDMGIHGWRLFNCPERLSYSATPPDFGSLTIQRRRWANGGLLILPKLRRQSRARRPRASGPGSVSCSCGGTTWRPYPGVRSACWCCWRSRSAPR
jgi:cellulose synthase/poly-beta-1,6-N-acetylglucosamine synthase-like glycosyltransferase